jgi:hypothetical protein
LNIKLFKSKTFIGLNVTSITTSNARAFKEFFRPLSVLPNSTVSSRMCVIYTSKVAIKMLGCALSIEKYGSGSLRNLPRIKTLLSTQWSVAHSTRNETLTGQLVL